MIRVVKMSGKYYGVKLTDDIEEEMNDIQALVEEGNPVIIVEDLTDLEELDIDADKVIMVNRD